jgi:hypothetical protein
MQMPCQRRRRVTSRTAICRDLCENCILRSFVVGLVVGDGANRTTHWGESNHPLGWGESHHPLGRIAPPTGANRTTHWGESHHPHPPEEPDPSLRAPARPPQCLIARVGSPSRRGPPDGSFRLFRLAILLQLLVTLTRSDALSCAHHYPSGRPRRRGPSAAPLRRCISRRAGGFRPCRPLIRRRAQADAGTRRGCRRGSRSGRRPCCWRGRPP